MNVDAEELCDIAMRISETREQGWLDGREVMVTFDDEEDAESVLSNRSSYAMVVCNHNTEIVGLIAY